MPPALAKARLMCRAGIRLFLQSVSEACAARCASCPRFTAEGHPASSGLLKSRPAIRAQHGFAGCQSKEACGGVAPQLADLACAGSETNVLQCPMSIGDDVFCAPEESVLLSCAGHGDPIGKPAAP